MREPAVSVGLPVFNGEAFLAESVESILRQSMEDLELVISDNGSTDQSADIAEGFARRDSRVRVLRQPDNRGAAWNYNAVFAATTGRLFKWAGHDDLCSPEMLARCSEHLERRPDAVLAFPATCVIDAEGARVGNYDDRIDLDHPDAVVRLARLVRHVHLANAVFGLIRRDALAATRLIGAYQGSDLVLLAELAALGPFVRAGTATFYRRLHAGTSRSAHRRPSEVAAWFSGGGGPSRRAFPRLRLVAEHARVAGRIPSPAPRRAAAAAAMAAAGGLKSLERVIARMGGRGRGGELAARLTSPD